MGGPEAAAPACFAEFKTGSVQDGARCRGEEQPCGYPPFTIQPGNIQYLQAPRTLLLDPRRLIIHIQLDQCESQQQVINAAPAKPL